VRGKVRQASNLKHLFLDSRFRGNDKVIKINRCMGEREEKLKQIRKKIQGFPNGPGLYFMRDCGDKVLYIGKAKNLRARVSSYFQPGSELYSSRGPRIVEMVNKVCTVDFIETKSEVDAILQEARLIKDIRPPYNADLTDDKSFPYLEITTSDDFPGVYMTRKPRVKASRLFGPFTGAKDLRAVLVLLQKIFRFRTCNLEIRESDDKRRFFRPCILYSIKQCVAPCAAKIEKKEYAKIIRDLVKFLKSKRSVILRQLNREMSESAAKLDYERAAVLRDRIRLIERLDRHGSVDQDVQPEVFAGDPTEALIELQRILHADGPIRIIEGIDVANIAGNEAVGSLVKFIDGRPFKSGYRRFKIKTVSGIDDYAMIAEVVKRRYKYALAGEELWPELVLIDGGLGHLHAAEEAFKKMSTLDKKTGNVKAEIPNIRIAAIAKKQEEIFLQGTTKPLKLPARSPARKLLQYVRDEAHRFAQHYHHILRKKKTLNWKHPQNS
jgi:excinuclease ABC subunit C